MGRSFAMGCNPTTSQGSAIRRQAGAKREQFLDAVVKLWRDWQYHWISFALSRLGDSFGRLTQGGVRRAGSPWAIVFRPVGAVVGNTTGFLSPFQGLVIFLDG